MARLRISERHGHGLLVADLADQDAVGRLAQRVLERDLEGLGVGADLALVHDRLLVLEDELDRILEGEDVTRFQAVAVIEHRGERGRLARPGGADHEDQSALLHDHFLQHVRQPEGIERRDASGDIAHHHRRRALLAERADAERADAFEVEGRVQLHLLLVLPGLALGEHLVEELADGVRGHDRLVDRDGHAVDLDVDRRADRKEDVRRLLVGHYLEQALHRGHRVLPQTGLPLV